MTTQMTLAENIITQYQLTTVDEKPDDNSDYDPNDTR
jgi:hypothetical protein